MERTQAFSTLRLDTTADGQMVSDAYWRLVRQAQSAAAADPERRAEIDRLNEAYTTLTPAGTPYVAPPKQQFIVPEGSGIRPLDAMADWVAAEALRTRRRWAQRNPEIAMIGGGALVLMFAAIGAGASLIAVFVAMAVVLVAIWSPWRRVE
jgi:hypothetical protein